MLKYEPECSSKPDPYRTSRHPAPPANLYSIPYSAYEWNPWR
jgi:hypothetical protein